MQQLPRSLPGPQQGLANSKWSLDCGIIGLPGPSKSHTLYHILPHLLPPQLWPLPQGPLAICPHPSALTPWWGERIQDPIPCRVSRDPSSLSASLTHLMLNYLYPDTNAVLSAPGIYLCAAWQPQDTWKGAGHRANVQVYGLADMEWKPSYFLYCYVIFGRSLSLSEPPL